MRYWEQLGEDGRDPVKYLCALLALDCFEALLLCGHVVGMPDLFLFCQIQFQGSCFSSTWRWHHGWGAIARKGKMQNTLEAELGKNRSDLKTQDHLVLDHITITSQQKGGTIARKEKIQNASWGKTSPATRQGFKPPALWIWMVFICNQGKLVLSEQEDTEGLSPKHIWNGIYVYVGNRLWDSWFKVWSRPDKPESRGHQFKLILSGLGMYIVPM